MKRGALTTNILVILVIMIIILLIGVHFSGILKIHGLSSLEPHKKLIEACRKLSQNYGCDLERASDEMREEFEEACREYLGNATYDVNKCLEAESCVCRTYKKIERLAKVIFGGSEFEISCSGDTCTVTGAQLFAMLQKMIEEIGLIGEVPEEYEYLRVYGTDAREYTYFELPERDKGITIYYDGDSAELSWFPEEDGKSVLDCGEFHPSFTWPWEWWSCKKITKVVGANGEEITLDTNYPWKCLSNCRFDNIRDKKFRVRIHEISEDGIVFSFES